MTDDLYYVLYTVLKSTTNALSFSFVNRSQSWGLSSALVAPADKWTPVGFISKFSAGSGNPRLVASMSGSTTVLWGGLCVVRFSRRVDAELFLAGNEFPLVEA
jgi:hypothetical protein